MEHSQLTALVEKSRQGDMEAQEKLVLEIQNRIYYHCKRFLKNEQDAQDATQDVLIAVITSLDKLKEPAAFLGWVNGITANRCRHLLSRGTKEWQIPEDEEGNSMLDGIETLDDQTVPDKAIDNAETQRLVMDIIDSLPPEQRMTVTFFYYDEMSVKEIAAAMNVSEGTVKSRLNYARKAIKLEVEKLEEKDGTKLYSVSILPFLAYFLRRGAQSEALSPAAAQSLTQGTMAAARSASAGAGTAAAAAGTSAGSTAAGAATAVAAKAAAGLSVKLIAGVLAGALVLGGVGAGVYVATHRDSDAEAGSEVETASPTPSRAAELDYATPYAQKVRELGEETQYALLLIDEDKIPELVTRSSRYLNGEQVGDSYRIYTVTAEGKTRLAGETATDLQETIYYFRQYGVIYTETSPNRDNEVYMTCYRLSEEDGLEEISTKVGYWDTFRDSGVIYDRDPFPEDVRGKGHTAMEVTQTAYEILGELGVEREEQPTPKAIQDASQPGEGQGYIPGDPLVDFDFSSYVGTYTPDQKMMESYSLTGLITDLTLYSDGALTGRVIHEGEPAIRLLSGSESKGGAGSYTLMLYEGKTEIEGYEITQEEYYIIYPQGVSDRYGGDSTKVRILYADLTGGAMEMLFTKTD